MSGKPDIIFAFKNKKLIVSQIQSKHKNKHKYRDMDTFCNNVLRLSGCCPDDHISWCHMACYLSWPVMVLNNNRKAGENELLTDNPVNLPYHWLLLIIITECWGYKMIPVALFGWQSSWPFWVTIQLTFLGDNLVALFDKHRLNFVFLKCDEDLKK